MYKILLVDDNRDLQKTIPRILSEGCSVIVAETILEAKRHLETNLFHLILLDVELPDGEGFKLCSYVQQDERSRNTPVIFMTGRAETDDKLHAFSVGADDYILKPFDGRELRARVMGRIAKNETKQKSEKEFRLGDLRFCLETQRAFASSGDPSQALLELSSVEFKLLLYFAKHEDYVLSRDQLMQAVWGDGIFIQDRTIDSHISKLRRKLSPSQCKILSVHGEGYRFSAATPAPALPQAA